MDETIDLTFKKQKKTPGVGGASGLGGAPVGGGAPVVGGAKVGGVSVAKNNNGALLKIMLKAQQQQSRLLASVRFCVWVSL